MSQKQIIIEAIQNIARSKAKIQLDQTDFGSVEHILDYAIFHLINDMYEFSPEFDQSVISKTSQLIVHITSFQEPDMQSLEHVFKSLRGLFHKEISIVFGLDIEETITATKIEVFLKR
jgi:cell division GTPase FtsZ